MSVASLTLLHAKYSLLETMRVPVSVIGTIVFPALALLFFVVPQSAVAQNEQYATEAVISMGVFAVMVGSLFSFGLGISENREKPWDPYLRTLPAPGIARVLAHIFSTGLMTIVALVPLVIIGRLLTEARATPLELLYGLLAIIVAALPFMLMGICIGYALSTKAAIAVIQIAFFTLAFAGGLFLPPVLFPDWLNAISQFLPSRQARDFVIWAVQGGEIEPLTWLGLLGWIALLLALALVLFRRDEGRRFR
ncbi:ABC transporter permease [Conyzicola nivalis]|uniref:ABC transporter n=1 Tax=Conyzicola nivalis TaxID=1477021 RepID=A0A916SUN2_9MICO|nr:ABC transporter permease [Conyzicola nivalis]GGB14278.1 ABC transporter [Conyzicola nivalis]